MIEGSRTLTTDEALSHAVWAVVDASTAPEKWGHRVYVALRARGYRAYAVNPRARAIAGDPCYRTLADLPE